MASHCSLFEREISMQHWMRLELILAAPWNGGVPLSCE